MKRRRIVPLILFTFALPLAAMSQEPFRSIRFASANMEPTIPVGTTLRVDLQHYQQQSPKRNDLILFRLKDDPRTAKVDESSTEYVSRVIAVAGDSIEVKKTSVILNGQQLEEPFAQWTQGGWKSFSEVKVPEGSVFVLGDNRDASKDSRFFAEPFIPLTSVLGKVSLD